MPRKKGRHPRSLRPPILSSQPQITQFQKEELKNLQSELTSRRLESLRLYRPTPQQEEFHRCQASERLVIGGNRSGKSLCTFVEDARAATGQDPYNKYPKKDGNLVIIGKDWRHIGMVAYALLFKAGAFKIIRDKTTGEWRAYDPENDAADHALAKPAPPLIPPRLIKSQSWVLKSANYIQKAELHNGWTIWFFSSEGTPPQGFQTDVCHIDEDVDSEQWVPEMQARLADRKGRFYWSAMPHSKNDALIGLKERADSPAQLERENPDIVHFKLRFLDNPHIDDDEKRKSIERWSAIGSDVLRMRAEGDFVTDSILVYPNFHMGVHGYDRDELPQKDIPRNWCRYAVVDPGHAVTAVLFAAVPPSEDMILVYDQLYIRQCNAVIFGEQFASKIRDPFHAFIVDMHGGRLRDIGSGKLPVEQYSEELAKRNIRSEITGSSFLAGCDDIAARCEATRTLMHIRPQGSPKLRVLRNAVPDLEREIKRYKKRVNYIGGTSVVTDVPNTKGEVHLCQCLEYLCAYNPQYHTPPKHAEKDDWWVAWAEKRRKQRARDSNTYVSFAPQGGVKSEFFHDASSSGW